MQIRRISSPRWSGRVTRRCGARSVASLAACVIGITAFSGGDALAQARQVTEGEERQPWVRQDDQPQPGADEREGRPQRDAFGGGRRGGGAGYGRGFGGGFGGMFGNTARVDSREVTRMASHFEFDDGQLSIVHAMFDGYSDAVDAEREEMRNKMRSMRDEIRDGGDWGSMMSRMGDLGWQSEQRIRELERSFLDDVRTTVLTETQQDSWSTYERDRRRRTTLRQGSRLAGESVDLVDLIDDLELTVEESDSIQPLLDQYASELDQALIARSQFFDSTMGRLDQIMQEDPEAAEATYMNSTQKSQAIVEINSRYAGMIAEKLQGETGERVRQEFNQTAYPRVYRRNSVDRYLSTVQGMESLSEKQQDSLKAIESDYRMRLRDINRQLIKIQNEQMIERQRRMFEGMRAFANAGDSEESRREMFEQYRREREAERGADQVDPEDRLEEQRRTIVNGTLEAIASVLSPEQLESAPKPDPEAERENRRQQWEQRMLERRQQRERDDN